jgi:dihydroorotate dehydrogenase (fumarate)
MDKIFNFCNMIDLTTHIGTMKLQSPIYNASGPLTKNYANLQQIDSSKSGAVLSKTCTIKARKGNAHPRLKIIEKDKCCLNSDGLDNHGIEYYANLKFKSPYIVSILANENTIEQMFQILCDKDNVCSIELNFACPNIGFITGYDHKIIDNTLQKIEKLNNFKPVGIKLPPYYNMMHVDKIIETICKYKVSYVTTTNTVGNAFICDDEYAAILPNNGLGGLSGSCIKYIALGNVRMISELLKKYNRHDINIIGVGGVTSGKDAFEMILCGASAVQVGTCHLIEGPSCFERIIQELKDIMQTKCYTNLEQFKGKIRLRSRI